MLDWDASSCGIVPTSLHSFEGDGNISAGLPASPYGPRLLSDPQVQIYISVCRCHSGCIKWMHRTCIAGVGFSMQHSFVSRAAVLWQLRVTEQRGPSRALRASPHLKRARAVCRDDARRSARVSQHGGADGHTNKHPAQDVAEAWTRPAKPVLWGTALPRQPGACWPLTCALSAAATGAQGRCAAVLLGHNIMAVLPAMTTDILDEMVLGAGSSSAGQQGLPTTVGNSSILKLAKHDIAEVASSAV